MKTTEIALISGDGVGKKVTEAFQLLLGAAAEPEKYRKPFVRHPVCHADDGMAGHIPGCRNNLNSRPSDLTRDQPEDC